MTNPNSPDLIPMWEEIGIRHNDLGCVMLDLDLLSGNPHLQPVIEAMQQDAYHPVNRDAAPWVDGIETRHHVTLLYGLTIPPYEYPAAIELLLRSHGQLEQLERFGVSFTGVEVFDSNVPGENYACIVLTASSSYLRQANEALRLLPHIDTWPTYKPHATIGYVRKTSAPYWADQLTRTIMAGNTGYITAKVTGVNLGKEKPWLSA